MADIHVLEGSFRDNGSGSFRIAYHISIPSAFRDGSIARYPDDYTRESQVIDTNTTV